ncbi:MAG: tetratricopeptide repeat protein [Pseudomonadota bacterium]
MKPGGTAYMSPAPGSGPAEAARRSTWKDVVLGIAVSFVILALLEGALRISGVPSVETEDDPYVGFSRTKPLFEVHNGVASTVPDKTKYFNQASFQSQKPANTFRIFSFGGSTTYGHPFDGRTSFSRWLQDLLNTLQPGTAFEVINAGGISYASYRIVPLVEEALRYQPDLMIIYTGHNEFLERRTYAGLFSQGTGLVTLRSVLEDLHIHQALKRVIEPLLQAIRKDEGQQDGRRATAADGRGGTFHGSSPAGKSILKGEVTAILDRSAGLDLYYRDEQFSAGVIEHFARNLETMIRVCKRADIPVVVVEPPSNLRDFSPFKSEHRKDLTSSEKSRLDRKIRRAADLVRQGGHERALTALDEAIKEDPLYAEAYFWRGKAMLGMDRLAEARSDFVKAKDLDVCPLRCITGLEEKIRQVCAKEHVALIHFEPALVKANNGDEVASAVPGNESFLDHVHPTIEGHQLLAELIMDEMIRARLVRPKRVLTREERDSIYDKGIKALDPQFFVTRDLNLVKTLRWAGKKDEARQVLLKTAERLNDNPEVHKMLGSFLVEDGNYGEAIEEYNKAVQLSGGDPVMRFSLGNAYYKAGRQSESQEIFEKLLAEGRPMPDAWANLAMIHLEAGKADRARAVLEEGLAKSPDAEQLFGPYALTLAISGNPSKAVPWMVRAVEAEPGDAGNLYNLAGMYALSGKAQDALHTLNQAVDKGYASAEKMEQDPVFASIRDVPEFSRIVSRIR